MEYEEAKALKESWGDKPCNHPSYTDKYLFGSKTGDFVCEQCGQFFTQRQKDQRARSVKQPALGKLLEQNVEIRDRLAVISKHKDLLALIGERDPSASLYNAFTKEQESFIKLADTLIKEMGV